MLGNVYDLNLSECGSIVDVSSLTNVHTLNLSHCLNIINGRELIDNVCALDLSYCNSIAIFLFDYFCHT